MCKLSLDMFPAPPDVRSWFSDWFYVTISLQRGEGRYTIVSNQRRVPRVRLYYGYDHAYMDMKKIGVYWSPRSPCQEGEEMYRHYLKFQWRPLFRFDWR